MTDRVESARQARISAADKFNHDPKALARIVSLDRYKPAVGVGLAAVRGGLEEPTLLAIMAASALPKEGYTPRVKTRDAEGNPKSWWGIPTQLETFLFDDRNGLSEVARKVITRTLGERAIGRAMSSGVIREFARTIILPLNAAGTRQNISSLEEKFSRLFTGAVKTGRLYEARLAILDDVRSPTYAAQKLRNQLIYEGQFAAIIAPSQPEE